MIYPKWVFIIIDGFLGLGLIFILDGFLLWLVFRNFDALEPVYLGLTFVTIYWLSQIASWSAYLNKRIDKYFEEYKKMNEPIVTNEEVKTVEIITDEPKETDFGFKKEE